MGVTVQSVIDLLACAGSGQSGTFTGPAWGLWGRGSHVVVEMCADSTQQKSYREDQRCAELTPHRRAARGGAARALHGYCMAVGPCIAYECVGFFSA